MTVASETDRLQDKGREILPDSGAPGADLPERVEAYREAQNRASTAMPDTTTRRRKQDGSALRRGLLG